MSQLLLAKKCESVCGRATTPPRWGTPLIGAGGEFKKCANPLALLLVILTLGSGCATRQMVREGARVQVVDAVTQAPVAGAEVDFVFDPEEESEMLAGLSAFLSLATLSTERYRGTITVASDAEGMAELPAEYEWFNLVDDGERLDASLHSKNRLERIDVSAPGYADFESPGRSVRRSDERGAFKDFHTPEFWENFPRLKVLLKPAERFE